MSVPNLPSVPGSSPNITWHTGSLTRDERARALKTRGCTVWLTGLSASGKSTIAAALEAHLVRAGRPAYRLDGDNLRHGLCADLGFTAPDRTENIRRVGEVCRLFADAGLVAIAAFISPYQSDRDAVRAMHTRDRESAIPFIEVFVDTPLSVCESRDPKGLYKKARAGQITGFTGIDDPYQRPQSPELTLDTRASDVDACVQLLVEAIARATGLPGYSPA